MKLRGLNFYKVERLLPYVGNIPKRDFHALYNEEIHHNCLNENKTKVSYKSKFFFKTWLQKKKRQLKEHLIFLNASFLNEITVNTIGIEYKFYRLSLALFINRN